MRATRVFWLFRALAAAFHYAVMAVWYAVRTRAATIRLLSAVLRDFFVGATVTVASTHAELIDTADCCNC